MAKKFGLLLPVVSGILFGSVGIFVRKLDQYGIDSYTILTSRVLVATIILFICLFYFKRELLIIKLRDSWLFLLAGLLGMLGLNLFYNEAINNLSLSFAAVLLSLAPFFVLFLAKLIFKDRITSTKIMAMIVALVGCVLASGIIGGKEAITFSPFGVSMGIAAAFCYSLYTIFSKLITERQYSVYTILFYSLLICTVVLLPFTNWEILNVFIEEDPINNVLFIIIHALCTAILPYLFYTLSFSIADTTTVATIVSGGEPVAAMLFGLILFSEFPTVISFSGVILTIIALTIYCRIKN